MHKQFNNNTYHFNNTLTLPLGEVAVRSGTGGPHSAVPQTVSRAKQ